MSGIRIGKWIGWHLFVKSNNLSDEGVVTECLGQEGVITFETETGEFSFYSESLKKGGRGYEVSGDAPRKAYLVPVGVTLSERLVLALFTIVLLMIYAVAIWYGIKGIQAFFHSDILRIIADIGPL